MDDFYIAWPFLIPIVAIIGSFVYAITQTLARARVRELEVRERIAMIERGLVPPPEVDPRGFDRAMERQDRYRDDWSRHRAPGRHRRAGVTMMGVGFGLMVMLTSLAEPSVGFGVGGFVVILGLAFFLNGLFDRHDPPRQAAPPYPPPYPPPAPPAPPTAHAEQRRD
jgi:hypothetical protein